MMKPHLKTVFSNLEFRTVVLANSFGARDDEASLENPDITLLGDSFAFGCGVEKEQSCESFLEKLCRVAVLNLGLSGYGTVQEFLILKRWAARHKQLKNKLIVFLFYPNDLSENLGYGFGSYPTVYTENGLTRFSKCTRDGYGRWLKACNKSMSRGLNKHSYFASEWCSFIKRTKNALKGKKTEPSGEENDRTIKKADDGFGLVVKEIKAFCDKEGARILFVYCPTAAYYQERAKSIDDSSVSRIRHFLTETSIPFIDLRSALAEKDYYTYDGHWRPSGHYKAALAIKDYEDNFHLSLSR